jgi:hypothetical protein
MMPVLGTPNTRPTVMAHIPVSLAGFGRFTPAWSDDRSVVLGRLPPRISISSTAALVTILGLDYNSLGEDEDQRGDPKVFHGSPSIQGFSSIMSRRDDVLSIIWTSPAPG